MKLLSCFRPTQFADDAPPPYSNVATATVPALDVESKSPNVCPESIPNDQVVFIEDNIDDMSDILRKTSLQMHDNPELGWNEYKTHDLLTDTAQDLGIFDTVTRHAYGLSTAFEAFYEYGKGGPVIGFQSELDALPVVGHACGHNLIAISGLAAAAAVAKTLKEYQIPGKVILLGTPAEETTGGKITLLKKGAYKSMDACVMLHPAPTDGVTSMLAVSSVQVDYHGHQAHAAGAPWEGINAQDAAVNAYNAISTLRQQIKPTARIHGIIKSPQYIAFNIIPAEYQLKFGVRSETKQELDVLKKRVEKCFVAGAESTGCTMDMKWYMDYADLRNNSLLGEQYKTYMATRQGIDFPSKVGVLGSTDFGDVSYAVPSLHPHYRIPVGEGEGNHTPGFEKAAATIEAHAATLAASKGIAQVALRVIVDNQFRDAVKKEFRQMKQ